MLLDPHTHLIKPADLVDDLPVPVSTLTAAWQFVAIADIGLVVDPFFFNVDPSVFF